MKTSMNWSIESIVNEQPVWKLGALYRDLKTYSEACYTMAIFGTYIIYNKHAYVYNGDTIGGYWCMNKYIPVDIQLTTEI